jgi:hypothetical protein
MPRQVGWDHDEEEATREGEYREERWVNTYECVHEEEGQSLCGLLPGKQMDQSVLKDKGYANARVEASKVGRHGWDAEVWTLNIGARAAVLDLWG